MGRMAILDDLREANVPVPEKNTLQKLSKILSRDPDLVPVRGRGYQLTEEALGREKDKLAREAAASGIGPLPA